MRLMDQKLRFDVVVMHPSMMRPGAQMRFEWRSPALPTNREQPPGLFFKPAGYRDTTPMFAMVAPFVIEGTAQVYKTTPAAGARASKMT